MNVHNNEVPLLSDLRGAFFFDDKRITGLPSLLLKREVKSKRNIEMQKIKTEEKDYSTAGSQVVSKLSTGAARRCLTSQIGRDEVLSP